MAQELLSAKLSELDRQIARIHNRIQESEALDPGKLRERIVDLREECERNEAAIRSSLQCTKAQLSSKIMSVFRMMESAVLQAEACIKAEIAPCMDLQAEMDQKLLMAEYELDFALLAANRSLLISFEVIEQQQRLKAYQAMLEG